MKLAPVAAVALLIAAPAFAADPATPAPAAAAAKFTLDTPLQTIVADPAGKTVIDMDLPGLTTHAMYESFKGMSLAQLAPMSGGKISEASLIKVKQDLAAIK